jgi:hypothetical protein
MSAPITLTPSFSTDFHEKDLLKALAEFQSNPPTQETLARAQSAVVDAVADTNFREHILQEIRTLAGTVLQIEADFATISLSVSEIDDRRAVQDQAGVLVKFLPEWTSYHEVCSVCSRDSGQINCSNLPVDVHQPVVLISDNGYADEGENRRCGVVHPS